MKHISKVFSIFLIILNIGFLAFLSNSLVINLSISINLMFIYLWLFRDYGITRSNKDLNELINSNHNTSNNYIKKIEDAYNNNIITLEEIDNLRQEFSKLKV